MRSNNIFLASVLLIGQWGISAAAEDAPRRIIPLPFLRGGAAAASSRALVAKQRSTKKQRQQLRRTTPIVGRGIGREWDKLASSTSRLVANVPKFPPFAGRRRRGLKSSKLDEVCHTFSTVLRSGDEVDTAQLLRACRAHVDLMKTGGPSLRLVARDLESNVKKAEEAFRQSPRDGQRLSTLLERERGRGVHKGSELHERSAAMGLLWIRRSLAFQLDLYACLASGDGHPRDAAYGAYERHLAPYHGWALQKIFPASLSQMPDRRAFLAKFGGVEIDELSDEHDREIARKLRSLIGTWDPLLSSWKGLFERLGLEDTRKV